MHAAIVIVLIAVLVPTFVIAVAGRRRAPRGAHTTPGHEDGGIGPLPAAPGPGPGPAGPDDPAWWPAFERAFRLHVAAREASDAPRGAPDPSPRATPPRPRGARRRVSSPRPEPETRP